MGIVEDLTRTHPRLGERALVRTERTPDSDGEFVLYWIRTAMRGHENPALDSALALAEQSGLPLLVYQGLSERYPFASDRHHTFILEGARDLALELGARGIRYVFHLERAGHRGDTLRTLARRSAIVVTELMPVSPLQGWTARLAGSITAPVVEIDTSCVLPMTLVDRPHERAFAFRRATEDERNSRLHQDWVEHASTPPPFTGELPFEPTPLSDSDLAELVGGCEIDHSVAPVPGMHGGSRAGYERWECWKERGLPRYHRRRNDATDRDGVSRLSPWLHYGMVSPPRIARETAELSGGGPEKFLDELLIWRELAHAFCFHRTDLLHSTEVLPAWARKTLAQHEGDDRMALPSWETLARGRTGDRLWDVAQRSLRSHGELHNNLRMTWGKALLGWTEDADQALDRLIDLNHRFALDGRDPNSYGGLLWCLGAFDSPKRPEREILGSVRPRPTESHAERLDLDALEVRVAEPSRGEPLRVAVIGAGLAGLAAARTLVDHGHSVTIFEKARGPAGRTSTRRADPFSFDHGAQYFTARDPRFRRLVESWQHDGLIARWDGRIAVLSSDGSTPKDDNPERFVGVPGMNAVAKHLAFDLDVRVRTRVAPLARPENGLWNLADDEGNALGSFDRVIVTAPAFQAAELVGEISTLSARARAVDMQPCTAAMLACDTTIGVPFDGAFVESEVLSWLCRDSSKPGRPEGDQWVLHSTPDWSAAHWDRPLEEQAATLEAEFRRLTASPGEALHVQVHRWRYSIAPAPLADEYLADDEIGLVLCGDWCRGGRVEGAYLSGVAAAGHLLRRVARS